MAGIVVCCDHCGSRFETRITDALLGQVGRCGVCGRRALRVVRPDQDPPAASDLLLRLAVRCDQFAPAAVREAISELSGIGWVLGDAMLVASELVTNAVRHSECSEEDFLNVCVTRDGWLRISVVDPGASGGSAQIAERPVDLGGLGLKVVEALARSWGTERREDGYKVWAELELPE